MDPRFKEQETFCSHQGEVGPLGRTIAAPANADKRRMLGQTEAKPKITRIRTGEGKKGRKYIGKRKI